MQDAVITDGEVAVIRAAMDVIAGIGKRADHMGRLAETCDHAVGASFQLLNVANSYYGANLTHEQLHGRPKVEAWRR